MLVLSRRPGEKILFPSLGVTVEVLRSRGTVVRIGIEAPYEVAVVRGEIATAEDHQRSEPRAFESHEIQPSERHQLRNQLNLLTLKLELLRRQLEVGQIEDTDRVLTDALSELASLEQSVGDTKNVPKEASGIRVLIVEDHADERELLASCLRLAGMDVTTVPDGIAALDYLKRNNPPELVLLDMLLPGMDGPTFLNAVRKDRRLQDVRIFAVSGSPQTEFSTNPLPLDGWFSKPVRVDALVQAMLLEHTLLEHTTSSTTA